MVVEDFKKIYECLGGTEDVSKLNKFETLKKICEMKGYDTSNVININDLLRIWAQS